MADREHSHVMNAHAKNPKHGTKRPDGSNEPEYILHSDPARASQEDYRCLTCGKSHAELIGGGSDPKKQRERVEVSTKENRTGKKTGTGKSSGSKTNRPARNQPPSAGLDVASRSINEDEE